MKSNIVTEVQVQYKKLLECKKTIILETLHLKKVGYLLDGLQRLDDMNVI